MRAERCVDAYRGRRVLLTGATGFVGRWLAKILTRADVELWLTARSRTSVAALSPSYEIGGNWLIVDLAEPGAFRQLCEKIKPEVVFNAVVHGVDPSERDEAQSLALNVRLVEEIGDTLAGSGSSDWRGVRVVHIGSAAEYGSVDGPLTESAATHPVNLYGRSKLQGACALAAIRRRSGLRAITARLFTVYGPGEHAARLLPSLLAAAQSGARLPLTHGHQQRDFTYVEEVAEALFCLGALTGPVPDVVNVATGKLTSVRTFVECAARVFELSPDQLEFGALPYRRDENKQGPADTRLLRGLVGWVPACSIEEGLRRTVEFESCLERARIR